MGHSMLLFVPAPRAVLQTEKGSSGSDTGWASSLQIHQEQGNSEDICLLLQHQEPPGNASACLSVESVSLQSILSVYAHVGM